MKTPTYRQAVNPAQVQNIAMPTFSNKDGRFSDQATGLKQKAIKNMEEGINIGADTVYELFEKEARHDAILDGQIRTQEDMAIINQKRESIEAMKTARDGIQQEVNREAEFYQTEEDPSASYAEDGGTDLEDYYYQKRILEDEIGKEEANVLGLLEMGGYAGNISNVTRYNNLNKLFLQKVSADVENELNTVFQNNLNNPIGLKKGSKTLMETLGRTVPEQFRESVMMDANQSLQRVVKTAENNLLKQQDAEIDASNIERLTLLGNRINQTAEDGGNTTSLISEFTTLVNQQVDRGNMSSQDRFKAIDSMNYNTKKQKTLGIAHHIMNKKGVNNTNKINALVQHAENFYGQEQAFMNEPQKKAIYDEMMQKANKMQSDEISLRAGTAKANNSDLDMILKRLAENNLGKRIAVDESTIKYARRLAESLGRGDEFNESMSVYNQLNTMSNSPLTSMKTQVRNREEKLARDIGDGKLSAMEQFSERTIINNMQQYVSNAEAAVEKDPNGYLEYSKGKSIFTDQNGDEFYTTNLAKFNKDIKGGVDSSGKTVTDHSKYVGSVTDELNHRLDNKSRYIHFLGKFELMSKEEASNLSQNYMAMNINDKRAFINNSVKKLGVTGSKDLLGQMFVENPSAEIMSASIYNYGSIKDKQAVNTMNRGFDMMSEQKKKGGIKYLKPAAQSQLKTTILSKMQPYVVGQSAKMLPINIKGVEAFYYGKADFSDDESVDSELIDEAIQDIYGTKGEYEGEPVFIPAGKDEDWLDLTMREVEADQNQFFESQNIPLPINGYTNKPYNDFNEVRRVVRDMGFHLQSLGRGKYRYVNSLGFPIKNADGSSFRFDLYMKNEDPKSPLKLYGDK